MKSKIIFALLVVIAGIVAIAWRLKDNKETIKEQAELSTQRSTVATVTVDQVGKQTFSSDFTVNGTYQPTQQVMVISDVNGRITSLKVDDGTVVKRGQVMLTVDGKLIENELKTMRLNLKKAEKDLSRMDNLLKEGGVTEAQYEEAKLGVENLKVAIESMDKRLSDTNLKAPISGVINNMRIEEGSYLAPGTPVAGIVNISPIRLDVSLTEDQVVTVKVGQRVKVSADVLPGREMQGVVTFIDVQADPTKRFPVQIQVSATAASLRAGMNGQATFAASSPVAALAIPRKAFDGSILDGKVYVVENNIAKRRKVRTGAVHGDYVEILDGLSAGETIVLTGHVNLTDGAQVKVVE